MKEKFNNKTNRILKIKNRNKSFNLKFILLIIILIFVGIYFLYNINSSFVYKYSNIFMPISSSKNDNYSGIGQEEISGKDGYFTTFTTIEENKKIYKEFKQNGNSSWGKNSYWGGTMEENGCGITSLAIIASGYGKNVTPEDLRKEFYPVLDGNDFGKVLKNYYNIDNSDFLYDTSYFSNNYILEYLKSNRPVLVCVWNKPYDNRWTTASHYLVLLACDDNSNVYVSNPNGGKNDSKSSGWYNINEVTPFIAKILFVESLK